MSFNIFTNGTLADATQVNANENFLSTQAIVNRLNTEIAGTSGRITGENFIFDLYNSDTATYSQNMIHTGSSWHTIANLGSGYGNEAYVAFIEASSVTTTGWNDGVVCKQISTGSYMIYKTGLTYEKNRAALIKALFYGNGQTAHVTDKMSGVTAIRVADSRDVGKKGYYLWGTIRGGGGGPWDASMTLDYTIGASAGSVSSWSILTSASSLCNWEVPSGIVLNTATNTTVTEIGSDTSNDIQINPTTAQLQLDSDNASTSSGYVILLSDSTVSLSGKTIGSNGPGEVAGSAIVDYNSTYSIPAFSALTSGSLTCFVVGSVQGLGSTYSKTFVKGNTGSGTGVTTTYQVSFNNGTSYSDVTEKTWTSLTAGSQVLVKTIFTRTSGSDTGYIDCYGAFYK